MGTYRICFFGTPAAAVPALEACIADDRLEIVRVVTNPDRPSGRGHRLTPSPVKVAASAAGLEVWQPARPKTIGAELAALDLDACAIVAYGALLPADVLAAGGAGFVNLHFSLLPAWRGAAPVTHTLLAGDTETGVSCFVLDEGMDTGPVLTERRTPVGEEETAGALTERLAVLGAGALVDAVVGLVAGTLTPQPQPEQGASYAPKVTPEDARLDWTQPAGSLARAVRAFNPMPGAHTTLAAGRLKVHRAAVVPAGPPTPGGQRPGTVTALDADTGAPIVRCGHDTLRLDTVQPAGKQAMSGAAFAHGYRPLGEVLGGTDPTG